MCERVSKTQDTHVLFSLHDSFFSYFTFNVLALPAENIALRFPIRNLVGENESEETREDA